MAVLEAHGAHQNLVDELLEEVSAYNPEVDRELLARAFRFAAIMCERPDAAMAGFSGLNFRVSFAPL